MRTSGDPGPRAEGPAACPGASRGASRCRRRGAPRGWGSVQVSGDKLPGPLRARASTPQNSPEHGAEPIPSGSLSSSTGCRESRQPRQPTAEGQQAQGASGSPGGWGGAGGLGSPRHTPAPLTAAALVHTAPSAPNNFPFLPPRATTQAGTGGTCLPDHLLPHAGKSLCP